MPTQLQLRRGTTGQHNSFTGVVGEVTINTTKKTAVVHDGSTAGGLELLRADMSNVFASATPTITSLNTSGNVDIGGNLTVTGTTTFNGGTVTMGDANTDNVVFGADVNSSIIPNTDNTYNLGSAGQKWGTLNVVNITQTGNTSTTGTLTVTGLTSLNGGLALDTNAFTVADTTGNTAIAGTLGVTGDTTLTGDLAVNGGDLTTNQTTFNLLNATATTLNIGGASTATAIGAASGTTTVKADLTVDGDVQVKGGDLTTNQTTFNLLNTTATTLNVGGAATTLEIGAATGTTNINNNLDVDGDVNIDGGDLTVSTSTFNLANTTATTLNIGGAATTVSIGANTGTTAVNNNLTIAGDLTVSGDTTTLNTATLEVEDKNIIIAKVATPTDTTADGAGITIKGATDKTFNWIDATDAFTSSEHIETAAGKTLALSGSSSGKTTLNVSAAASGTLTLPAATDTLVGKATTDTLTNKSISLTTNTITGTTAEFNTALSDDNFVTLTGTETLTNKTLTTPVISSVSNSGTITIPTGTDTLVGRATTDTLTNKTLTSPVISSITNTGTITLPTSTDTLVGRATTDTLTNKSISLTTNTITGTLAEFNTALSGDDFVSLTGSETLTNKTLTSPRIGTSVLDTNGNELLLLTATASAVNELTLANAATTGRPTISATGTDTNIGIAITPKGTGTILVGNSIIPSGDGTMDLGSSAAKFRDLYLSSSSFFMGTTKVTMHADGYLQFNTNSAGGYPGGSNVKVATATNGVAPTTGTAAALAIALGG